MNDEIVGKFFYPLVVDDIDRVIDAIEYYKHVHAHGHQHARVKGVIERMMQDQPGLMRIYDDAHTDCAMIGKWLEEKIKHMKAKKRLWYLRDPEAKAEWGDLKKTEIDTLVAADDDIQYYIQLQLLLQLWETNIQKLVARLNQKGMYLHKISSLRIAGQREAYIDASYETNPETI